MFGAVLATPGVALSLRRRGYHETRQWLERRRPPHFGAPVDGETLVDADKAVRALPMEVTCLTRSMVVWWLSDRSARIRFGVDPTSKSVGHQFHAWLELDGRVVNDDQRIAETYLTFGSDDEMPPGDLPGTFSD